MNSSSPPKLALHRPFRAVLSNILTLAHSNETRLSAHEDLERHPLWLNDPAAISLVDNLQRMRNLYLAWDPEKNHATLSHESPAFLSPLQLTRKMRLQKCATASRNFELSDLAAAFPFLGRGMRYMSACRSEWRSEGFYETALLGGWSVRQLDRQIVSLHYERNALSNNKASVLTQGAVRRATDRITPEETLKIPCP